MGQTRRLHDLLSWWDADIALLALLVTFPVIGILAVLCIGVLVLQKLRLQTSLDDSCWWLINYSDITIIRESTVCALKHEEEFKRCMSLCVCLLAWFCVHRIVRCVCVSSREIRVYLCPPLPVTAGAAALNPISPTTAMAWGTRRGKNMSTAP